MSDALLRLYHRLPAPARSIAATHERWAFDRAAMDRMLAGFSGRHACSDALVRQLLMIHLWYQACVTSQSMAAGPANHR